MNNTLYNLISKLQYEVSNYDINSYNLDSLKYSICDYSKNILKEDFMMYEMNGTTYIGISKAFEVKVSSTKIAIECKESKLKTVEDFSSLPNLLQEIHDTVGHNNISNFGYINFNLAKYLYQSGNHKKDEELLYFFVPSIEVKISKGDMRVRYLQINPFNDLNEIYKEITIKQLPLKHDTEQSLLNQKCDLYKKNVNKAVEDIKDKLYSKVILSRKIIISERINMLHSYFLGLKINNPARSYLYDINGMELFGFSPETIVQVDNNNKVFTFPLAGTRKNKEHLKKELLTDIKEVGEHAVSVKLAVEELKNVCKSDTIKIEEFMNIYERGSVQHLGSVVSGILESDNYWKALLSLYPAVTASGIPKKESIRAIEKYEDTPRNLYSGGVFLINQDYGFDVALILRTVFQDKHETFARAGAGIVEKSKPDRELEETREKLNSILTALSL
ncbi:salicylate synthase [Staphylococcus schleiferi]|uniref:salicylate synthase n=1 Tax=Staphylococcus sp. 191 TaxID=2070016 RepID=UPI0013F46E3C|nr:salicylate synthase [Staphylococcus sp. 191]NHA37361.1 salicylate synthase [Staphylococcus schleiferi]NHB71803.1 salicylate synthase [Staphylococcus sp. 191]